MRIKIFIATLMIILNISGICGAAQDKKDKNIIKALNAMTLEQKVGQLFIIRPDQINPARALKDIHRSKASGDQFLTETMRETLKKYPAGGFAFFNKNIKDPEQLKAFTQDLINACEIPPIMAIDEEGGSIARIANHVNFNVPKFANMQSIGDTKNPQNAYNAAKIIGGYIKEYGFNMDFAPVADVNTNPENIIIGDRAFGSDPELVSKMAGAFLDGLHSQNIAGSLKHFPGHGDTKDDTHSDYVAVYKTWDELLKAELIPFKNNFKNADTVMTAHITLKNINAPKQKALPATLSKNIITGKLRDELGFNGVIITDALMMGAIQKNYSSETAALLAFEAGNDILLMPYDYRAAFNAILNAVKTGKISETRLNNSVLRILKLKNKITQRKP